MRFLGCVLVLLPHLNGLVALAAQQSAAAAVEGQREDAVLGSDGAGLGLTQDVLVVVAGLPVPELQSAVVSSAYEHVVLVYLNSVLFTASASMMELCPAMFLRNSPLGHFHTLMLSLAAVAKVYSVGCSTIALMDFLWLVRVFMHLPEPMSQSFTNES